MKIYILENLQRTIVIVLLTSYGVPRTQGGGGTLREFEKGCPTSTFAANWNHSH